MDVESANSLLRAAIELCFLTIRRFLVSIGLRLLTKDILLDPLKAATHSQVTGSTKKIVLVYLQHKNVFKRVTMRILT